MQQQQKQNVQYAQQAQRYYSGGGQSPTTNVKAKTTATPYVDKQQALRQQAIRQVSQPTTTSKYDPVTGLTTYAASQSFTQISKASQLKDINAQFSGDITPQTQTTTGTVTTSRTGVLGTISTQGNKLFAGVSKYTDKVKNAVFPEGSLRQKATSGIFKTAEYISRPEFAVPLAGSLGAFSKPTSLAKTTATETKAMGTASKIYTTGKYTSVGSIASPAAVDITMGISERKTYTKEERQLLNEYRTPLTKATGEGRAAKTGTFGYGLKGFSQTPFIQDLPYFERGGKEEFREASRTSLIAQGFPREKLDLGVGITEKQLQIIQRGEVAGTVVAEVLANVAGAEAIKTSYKLGTLQKRPFTQAAIDVGVYASPVETVSQEYTMARARSRPVDTANLNVNIIKGAAVSGLVAGGISKYYFKSAAALIAGNKAAAKTAKTAQRGWELSGQLIDAPAELIGDATSKAGGYSYNVYKTKRFLPSNQYPFKSWGSSPKLPVTVPASETFNIFKRSGGSTVSTRTTPQSKSSTQISSSVFPQTQTKTPITSKSLIDSPVDVPTDIPSSRGGRTSISVPTDVDVPSDIPIKIDIPTEVPTNVPIDVPLTVAVPTGDDLLGLPSGAFGSGGGFFRGIRTKKARGRYRPSLAGLSSGFTISKAPSFTSGIFVRYPVKPSTSFFTTKVKRKVVKRTTKKTSTAKKKKKKKSRGKR